MSVSVLFGSAHPDDADFRYGSDVVSLSKSLPPALKKGRPDRPPKSETSALLLRHECVRRRRVGRDAELGRRKSGRRSEQVPDPGARTEYRDIGFAISVIIGRDRFVFGDAKVDDRRLTV